MLITMPRFGKRCLLRSLLWLVAGVMVTVGLMKMGSLCQSPDEVNDTPHLQKDIVLAVPEPLEATEVCAVVQCV